MAGRKKTTGRYATRDELCREVWRRWLHSGANQSDIARACGVSAATVGNILDSKEGYPHE